MVKTDFKNTYEAFMHSRDFSRGRIHNKAVKKTLSIPSCLNDMADCVLTALPVAWWGIFLLDKI